MAWARDRHKYHRSSVCPSSREIGTKTSGRVYAAAQGVHGREGYVISRHGCALAGSDNSRVVVPTSSYQRELPSAAANMREDCVAMIELTDHLRTIPLPLSIITLFSAPIPLIRAQASK
jgi:hypothetical protein